MTAREFRRLLRFYHACLDSEDRRSLTMRLSGLHRSLVSPWDAREVLFHPDAPETAFSVRLRADVEVLRGAGVVGSDRFCYGYPIFLDRAGYLTPLFFVEVDVSHAEGRRFVLRTSGALQLNPHPFKRRQVSPEGVQSIRAELEGRYGAFMIRLQAAFERLGLPMPPLDPDRLEPYPSAHSARDRWVNRPVLFKSEPGPHTEHLRRELEAMAVHPRFPGVLRGTAAGVIAGSVGAGRWRTVRGALKAPRLLQIVPLNASQEQAGKEALRAPLAVVTGPPGTGKSQLVVDLLASCVLAGRPVLFSSRNNKAVDVVYDRLRRLLGHDRDWTLRLGTRRTMAVSRHDLLTRLHALGRDPVHASAAETAASRSKPPPPQPCPESAALRESRQPPCDSPTPRWSRVRRALAPLAEACAAVARLAALRPATLTAGDLGAWWTGRVSRRAEAVRGSLDRYFELTSRVGQVRGPGTAQIADQFTEAVRLLARRLPIWIVTNLSVRNALPLEPALFDLVILDEASQCDIASALPLLFRARRALVIGDSRQLRHISTLSRAEEERLAFECGVTDHLTAWSYTEQSLYALAECTAVERGGKTAFLEEHYRSHPEIIRFSNRAFYQQRLIVRTAVDELRRRFEDEPLGLYWHDVPGRVCQSAQSAVNESEAQAILALLDEWRQSGLLLRGDIDFGIVTPFRRQMERIDEAVRKRPWGDEVQRRLTVGTAHRFQGDERDVMIFSPVVAEGMPPRLVRWAADSDQMLNVAITRARAALHVVGDLAACLASGGFLGDFARTVTKWSPSIMRGGRPPEPSAAGRIPNKG